jgi:hypothetical protein
MIKIRYRDPNELSPGLHAAAERQGRNTTVYMIPGLTAAERRSALRRLRISARMGQGPRLPAPQLALALAADRIRTTLGQAGTIFRSHPAGSTVPVMVVSAGAIAFLVVSAVSIRVIHNPAGPGPSTALGHTSAAGTFPAGGSSPDEAAGSLGDLGGLGARPPAGSSGAQPGHAGSDPDPGSAVASGGTAGTDPGSDSGSSGGGTTMAGGPDPGDPSPTPDGTGTGGPPAAPAASTAPSAAAANPSATPSPSTSGLCLHMGPLGFCL